MDRNLLLAFALSFLVLSTWSMVQQKNRAATPSEVAGEIQEQPREGVDVSPPQRFPELPEASPAAPPLRASAADAEPVRGREISVDRPLYRVDLDSRGGVIRRWELKRYVDRRGDPVVLVDFDPSSRVGGAVAGTPLLELELGDLSSTIWGIEREEHDLVAFGFEKEGVRVLKTYRFEADTYAFRMLLEIENASKRDIEPRFLVDWAAEVREGNDFREQALAVLHDGSIESRPVAGLGSAGFFGAMFGKKPVSVYEPLLGEIDWVGFKTPYFLGALIPDTPERASARIIVLEQSRAGAVELFFDPVRLPPGQSVAREFRGYIGPKEPERLEAMGGDLRAAIDSGWAWVAPLTRMFSWLLHALHAIVPNYGVAIIILTLLVRLVTAPLTLKQMRSMERMRRLQPKMKQIQAEFAEDRQKQSEAMMRLYKQEKVNPLGGCFPMLLQFPVFIGLYYALRSSIELRQAPFVSWIDDLSAPDELFMLPGIGIPVRVLPLIMGATMVLQQKITPMQADPAQARMMMTIMPIMMTVLFYQFPSGLVLYWMLSNVLAIGHQLWIGRKMQPVTATQSKQAGKEDA
ncbi:MAG: membrane protein insertase YidC [Myxococcales bacterium]|nr:membrane protein insertase YidC [Myxococcales bacterium]MDH5306036.1 membrane protein insertase YidC [Myxococcales bacterium]MDH5565632.1 membrane protein insertase YidC [Myxococcales bacterium]